MNSNQKQNLLISVVATIFIVVICVYAYYRRTRESYTPLQKLGIVVQPEVKPEVKPIVKPVVKPVVKPEVKPEVKPTHVKLLKSEECEVLKKQHNVVAGKTFGTLTTEQRAQWTLSKCAEKTRVSDDKPKVILTPEECSALAVKYNVEVGKKWGTLPTEFRSQWNQSECSKKHQEKLDEKLPLLTSTQCKELGIKYGVVSGESWGTLPEKQRGIWNKSKCSTL